MKIIQYRNIFIYISLAIMAAAVVIIGFLGLNLGIDFTGGSLMELSYEERPAKEVLEAELAPLALGGYSLRQTIDDAGRPGYILSTRDLTIDEQQQVEAAVTSVGSDAEVVRFTSIGPVIGEELKDKAVWAISGVVLIIVLYVAFAFAGVGKPVSSWIYSSITIFALIHDILVPTAIMSLLGYFLGLEVDVLFVMVLLSILGYSVNDTIVIFDRVRENLIKYRQEKKIKEKDAHGIEQERIEYIFTKPFDQIVGQSISETMVRSINTSLTTFLAVVALYFFGGTVTQTFALILGVGIIAGTYSSIFLASPLLVFVERWQSNRSK